MRFCAPPWLSNWSWIFQSIHVFCFHHFCHLPQFLIFPGRSKPVFALDGQGLVSKLSCPTSCEAFQHNPLLELPTSKMGLEICQNYRLQRSVPLERVDMLESGLYGISPYQGPSLLKPHPCQVPPPNLQNFLTHSITGFKAAILATTSEKTLWERYWVVQEGRDTSKKRCPGDTKKEVWNLTCRCFRKSRAICTFCSRWNRIRPFSRGYKKETTASFQPSHP